MSTEIVERMADEILARHIEYMGWPESGQVMMKVSNARAAIIETLTARRSAADTIVALKARDHGWRLQAEEQEEEIAALKARVAELEGLADEAFDFLGGVDGAVEIRQRILAALQTPVERKGDQ